MMLEEYGVVPETLSPVDAKKELRKSLSDWRLAQAQAVIRDTPLLALDFFEDEGFQVIADPKVHDRDMDPRDYFRNRTEKLTEL